MLHENKGKWKTGNMHGSFWKKFTLYSVPQNKVNPCTLVASGRECHKHLLTKSIDE